MPEALDPSTLNRPDSISYDDATPQIATKTLATSAYTPAKPAGAPRVDLETIYTGLKEKVGDDWGAYKDALSNFVLGRLNQREFSRLIYPFITVFPEREHLHNQLVSGIFGNALRDPPDNGVAGWVSANDKPTATGPKASVSGDAAEQRLKIEITRLPLRDRARLKRVQDDAAADRFVRSMLEWREAKSVKVPEMTQSATGGVTRTNWELEIRKRFSQPLCSEALEVPDADSLLLRMGPLCYEEGLAGGPAAGTADFMNTATETFIKEALNHLFSRSRSNGPVCGTGGAGVTSHSAVGGAGWVMTGRYKKRIRREEDLCARGQLRRDATGLLPTEAEEARKRRALGVGDLKLSLRLGDPWLAQMPLVSDKLLTGIFEEVEEDSDSDSDSDSDEAVQQIGWEDRKPVTVNGSTPYTNGVKDDEMSIDENDWGWPGCARRDHQALGNVLDDCLSVTQ